MSQDVLESGKFSLSSYEMAVSSSIPYPLSILALRYQCLSNLKNEQVC